MTAYDGTKFETVEDADADATPVGSLVGKFVEWWGVKSEIICDVRFLDERFLRIVTPESPQAA